MRCPPCFEDPDRKNRLKEAGERAGQYTYTYIQIYHFICQYINHQYIAEPFAEEAGWYLWIVHLSYYHLSERKCRVFFLINPFIFLFTALFVTFSINEWKLHVELELMWKWGGRGRGAGCRVHDFWKKQLAVTCTNLCTIRPWSPAEVQVYKKSSLVAAEIYSVWRRDLWGDSGFDVHANILVWTPPTSPDLCAGGHISTWELLFG